LRARLSSLPTQTARRRRLAARYRRALEGAPVIVPRECDAGHVYHLFPVRAADRDGLRAHLRAHGIGSLIHYPRPLTRQPVFAGVHPSACPVADRVCQEVCSLPLHPQLTDEDVDLVAAAVHAWRPSLSPAQL
jgi:dTDP-4-amino-4,6-dideoxygalactose transaminase